MRTQITRHAFTLIELLIVVAILAILAAIAVPNLLEAQTRAKVSRAKADLRTIATALESYAVDHSAYPYEQTSRMFPHQLTTPVAYLASAVLDNFRVNAPSQQGIPYPERTVYYYRFMSQAQERRPEVASWRGTDADYECDDTVLDLLGAWGISSFGPDLDRDSIWPGLHYSDPLKRFYDPSNGTISNGDIGRTQAQKLTNTR